MARPLSAPAPRRQLAAALVAALLGHAVVLSWLSQLLRPPSLLSDVAAPFYTRTLTPEAPAEPPTLVAEAPAAPARPTAVLRTDPEPDAPEAPSPPIAPASVPAPQPTPPPTPSKPQPAPEPAPPPPAPEPEPLPGDPPEPAAEPGLAPASNPAADPAPDSPPEPPSAEPADPALAAASAPDVRSDAPDVPSDAPDATDPASPPAFLATWPTDTRLRYRLGGYYRGELHGDAQVLWQRQGTRYQAVVQLDVGFLLSSRFTSQGAITAHGLRPEVYEEQVRQRRRGVRLGEDVRLNNGERVPLPAADVQDAASQFVELGHRFATGQARLAPGAQIDFWLARPGGVDAWTYDVVGEETLHLPRLGPVQAFHLKPRPTAKPRGSISAEIWFAPSLQYLPVRIRLTQDPETHVDLMVETVEQQ
ncbi:MAG: DUF3108 domain-containing protein [Pseudomonadota bacterium]|nr:DUF3108 domain-containing protein [Pseudomonadota bacterium]